MPSGPAGLPSSLYRVTAASPFNWRRFDPDRTPGWKRGKSAAVALTSRLAARLEELQEVLFAEQKHRLLVVLQGMDTSGKDGAIRHVFEGVNPAGVQVASFKAPTSEELAHDFLWRVHRHVPGNGQLVILNRSHYEDVLAARVRGFVPKSVWSRRYRQIVEFERLLVESGTTILKFFLHISKDEQRSRLQARLADPAKRWKFRRGDLEDRALWGEYQEAYADAVRKTSSPHAPWHVIPADKKWYRDLAVASVIIETLDALRPAVPPGEAGIEALEIP